VYRVDWFRDDVFMADAAHAGGLSLASPRRRRSAEERRLIVEETLEAGSSVARVAMKLGAPRSHIIDWRILITFGTRGCFVRRSRFHRPFTLLIVGIEVMGFCIMLRRCRIPLKAYQRKPRLRVKFFVEVFWAFRQHQFASGANSCALQMTSASCSIEASYNDMSVDLRFAIL
jgi:hypothetical protein